MIKDVLKYVNHFLHRTKINHPTVNETLLKSALVYQYLYFKHFTDHITIANILENDPDIWLIGLGRCLTIFLERLFGWSNIIKSHAILHDAFGRFYNRYQMDRGYCYALYHSSNYMNKYQVFYIAVLIKLLYELYMKKNH